MPRNFTITINNCSSIKKAMKKLKLPIPESEIGKIMPFKTNKPNTGINEKK